MAETSVTRMKRLLEKLDMGVLDNCERALLTSTLTAGAARMDMQEQEQEQEPSPPPAPPAPSQNTIEGPQATVRGLSDQKRSMAYKVISTHKCNEGLKLMRMLDWRGSGLTGDWRFAGDALTAGCRSPEIDGVRFSDCFGDRVYQYSVPDVLLIQQEWIEVVKAYLGELEPQRQTEPVPEVVLMDAAMRRWRKDKHRVIREQVRVVNLGALPQERVTLAWGAPKSVCADQ